MEEKENNLCVLLFEISISSSILSSSEKENVLKRAFRRIINTSENHEGVVFEKTKSRIHVNFNDCKNAITAIFEIFERIENLPPPGGKPFKLRAGLSYGKFGISGNIYGTVTTSAMEMLLQAKAGEILATSDVYQNIDKSCFQFEKKSVSESSENYFYKIIRFLEDGFIMTKTLEVRYKDEILVLDENRPVLLLGREKGNDIVIDNSLASRQHARIEWKNGLFMVTDHSTNGCYVFSEENENSVEVVINKDSTELIKKGKIGCGFSTTNEKIEPVLFEIIETK